MDIDDVYWHDGNLVDVSIQIGKKGKSKLIVIANFYENEQSSERSRYKVTCKDLIKSNLNLDMVELKDNMFAGNISNGYLKNSTLWLYFTDGTLEVKAKKFIVTKC
jgi:hypothetical protein